MSAHCVPHSSVVCPPFSWDPPWPLNPALHARGYSKWGSLYACCPVDIGFMGHVLTLSSPHSVVCVRWMVLLSWRSRASNSPPSPPPCLPPSPPPYLSPIIPPNARRSGLLRMFGKRLWGWGWRLCGGDELEVL